VRQRGPLDAAGGEADVTSGIFGVDLPGRGWFRQWFARLAPWQRLLSGNILLLPTSKG
jgi:hypothetical protein